MDYPYQVFNQAGQLVLQADLACRYSRLQEQLLLENGYTIKINGKRLTKTQIKKDLGRK